MLKTLWPWSVLVTAFFLVGCGHHLEPWDPQDGVHPVQIEPVDGFAPLMPSPAVGDTTDTVPLAFEPDCRNDQECKMVGDMGPVLDITVPPSDKATRLRVNRKKLNLYEKVLTNEAGYTIVASADGVTASQPKKKLLMRWAYLMLGLVLAAVVIAMRSTILGFIRKLK